MNEFIQILISISLWLSAIVASSIVDEIVEHSTLRISLIVFIGILTGMAIINTISLKVV